MHFCSATANCLLSAYGSGHRLHPTGPRQPALNPVPSHTQQSRAAPRLQHCDRGVEDAGLGNRRPVVGQRSAGARCITAAWTLRLRCHIARVQPANPTVPCCHSHILGTALGIARRIMHGRPSMEGVQHFHQLHRRTSDHTWVEGKTCKANHAPPGSLQGLPVA